MSHVLDLGGGLGFVNETGLTKKVIRRMPIDAFQIRQQLIVCFAVNELIKSVKCGCALNS